MAANLGPRPPRILWHNFNRLLAFATGLSLLALWGCGAKTSVDQNGPPPQIADFIARKESQARALAKELDLKISSDVWAYFRMARTGKVSAVTNAFERLKSRSSQYEGSKDDPTVGTPIWQTLLEVELAIEGFADPDPKYSMAFGNGVIESIPPGSIYFGGTDPGRGLVTALSRSHADGDPFFTITQNAFADSRYLDYLRVMYGSKIHMPTADDSQNAFQEYLMDAQKRLTHDNQFPNEPPQIKPGEDVRIVNDRVQVSGQVAVMTINGLLAKIIFEANPDHEFYVEESFPLDWMYPHLSPHKFIFKLNRQPLAELSDAVVKMDREFWTQQLAQMIGDWLTPETSVNDVCVFALKVHGRKDLAGFTGDRKFVESDYANKMYSKLRSAGGGLYQWRVNNANSPTDREKMTTEADFAFRQAFALCPRSPEAIFRYVNLLLSGNRMDDAFRVASTAQLLEPDNSQLDDLVTRLRRQNEAQKK